MRERPVGIGRPTTRRTHDFHDLRWIQPRKEKSMITHTIQSFAVTLSDAGYGSYVIVDLAKATPDAVIPAGLPHGVGDIVGGERTAIEFPADDDMAYVGANAYREIVDACRSHQGVLRGSIALIEGGEVESTSIG